VLDGDVPKAVAALKQSDGGAIGVAGSRTLVQTLLEHNLVDELRLMVFPVILGSGGRLFPQTSEMTTLKLVDTQTFESGVQANVYEVGEKSS
jgi:dihydrofolate reductase